MAYSSNTRVGNWSEEKQERERTIARLQAQRAAGTLACDVHAVRLAAGNAPVVLAKQLDDGLLRFGDALQLCSSTGGALAACVHDPAGPPDSRACAAVLSPSEAPVVRATLSLENVAVRSVEDEAAALMRAAGPDVVHYGQKIRVRLHPGAGALAPPPVGPAQPGAPPPHLALSSVPVSMAAVARHSKHQLVSWTAADAAYDTVWQVLTPDPAQQLAAEGQAVMLGAPVLLRHCHTLQCLSAEPHGSVTAFGNEREVAACTQTGAGHRFALTAAAHGKPEHAVVKGAMDMNVWRFA